MVVQITAIAALTAALLAATTAFAQDKASIERGLYVSIVGGCHDCHTAGYRESGGTIDLDKAMKGDATFGWRSPQGVAYAANLRLFAFIRDEDAFVGDMKGLPALLPPMLSPQAADLLEAVGIDKEPRKLERPSDHTPIWARLAAA